jgi:hypothetical protein
LVPLIAGPQIGQPDFLALHHNAPANRGGVVVVEAGRDANIALIRRMAVLTADMFECASAQA